MIIKRKIRYLLRRLLNIKNIDTSTYSYNGYTSNGAPTIDEIVANGLAPNGLY